MTSPALKYLPFLKKILTPHRLRHSLGAMQVMGELAPVYDLDQDQAETIGILHDAAKNLSSDQYRKLVDEANIEIRYECDHNYNLYLHGPIGAYFVQKELGITDTLTIDAIAMHTFAKTGANFHHPMIWCMRFSDILEPNRNWDEIKWVRENIDQLRILAFSGRMVEAGLLHVSVLIDWFDEVGMPVHPNFRKVKKEYDARLRLPS